MISEAVATQGGFWIGVVGVIVSLVGFAIAWQQLRRTRTAVEAVLRAEDRIATNTLLSLLPRFEILEREVARRVHDGDEDGLAGLLIEWRNLAAAVR